MPIMTRTPVRRLSQADSFPFFLSLLLYVLFLLSMPITIRSHVRRPSQAAFWELAYMIMGDVFDIHRDMGRFFDEKIYKRELSHRCPEVQLEFQIEITHETFRKVQYIDVLVSNGGPFEFKTVDAITPRHP